ncbi:Do family serine endopeptidase [Candidatus Phycosocius spiralis]|uniref:Serine protease n=1 Tax=Candidatus Phycosocius spiralis TaxID=2815099 RepID=A0ABQ4PY04_9PROT|nr:Do family serine endopeptidase [Candidatus Phycosocius spiralis]GIU67964.1 serine protease [Candidatus Phycosocius spiralis]
MEKPTTDRGQIGMWKWVAASVLSAAFGAGLVSALPFAKQVGFGTQSPSIAPLAKAPSQPVQGRVVPATKADAISSYAPIVRRSSMAVVNVYARSIQKGRVAIDFFGGAFRIPDRASQSQGSGVIVRDDGIIVTNNHVVQGATELVVVLGDRREFPAQVVLTDPRTDLAVLRIDTKGERLVSLRFADTTTAQVGDQVIAIGNPFGVGQTVTAGIISALARTDVGITDFSFFIQTDASINPGNSGGALVDMNGDLVGVNTAIYSGSGNSAGVGFAIPAEMVRRVVEGAVTDGKVIRAWTGIKGQNVDAEVARTLGLSRPGGVLVTEIYPNSPAALAGLRRGDVVTSFAGAPVSDDSGLRYQAATRKPGEVVEFGFQRQGQVKSSKAALTSPPGEAQTPQVLSGRHSFDGVRVVSLSPAIAEEQGIDPFTRGAFVVGVDGSREGARAGLRPGDVIVEINDQSVATAADLAERLNRGRQGKVTILRGDRLISAILFL